MNSIKFNTLTFAIFNLGERLISFFLLPLVANSVSEVEYGLWTQTVITAGILTPVVIFGFGTSIVKFYPLYKASFSKVIKMMLCTVGLIFILVAISFIYYENFFSVLIFGGSKYQNFIMPMLVLLFGEVLFEFFVGYMRARAYIKIASLYIFLKGLLRFFILYVVLIHLNKDIYDAILFLSSSQIIFVITICFLHIKFNQAFNISVEVYREIIKFSAPLVPMALLIGLGNFSDRYFLANNGGLYEVAVYSASSSLIGVAAFFYSSIGFTLYPRLSNYWSEGDMQASRQLFIKILQTYATLIIPFIFGATAMGPLLLVSLTTEQYSTSRLLFLLLSLNVSMFGLYQIFYYIQLLEHGSLKGLYLIFISTALNIILNFILIPKLGMVGAAISGTISIGFLSLASLKVAHTVLHWSFPWKVFAIVILHSIIMGCFLFLSVKIITIQNIYTLITEITLGFIIYIALNFSNYNTSLINLVKNK
jgi:O-antigen/teichoic acid export membrane protein